MAKPFYVTTPIYYVNARPHLGHAYTTIVADVIRRFHTMTPVKTFLLTGTDEHGDKIVQAAEKAGVSPRAYADEISGQFRDLWPQLDVCCDHFIRTTDSAHIDVVLRVLQSIYDAGDIYFSEYEGRYCFGCERFYTDRELVDGKCPDHQTVPETIREANYFFRMSRYQQWLIDHIHSHPDFIRPERYKNEVLAFLREPLEDLCISRPKSRLEWGITLPFDDRFVTYVWFDALLNYVSALGYPDGRRYAVFWPEAQHIVAKDILKPHGIYWPIMLKAAGIPVYQHLNVHGYWNIDAGKMSKSLGNVVEPLQMKDRYGLDAFRFFLIRDMVFGLDANFSAEAMVQRINSDLANDLGNLFSRTLTMAHKYLSGIVPPPPKDPGLIPDNGLRVDALAAVAAYERHMPQFAFHKALAAVWEFINRMNRFIDTTAPWALAKAPETRPRLQAVLYELLEGLRVVAGLIYPVMPRTAAAMAQRLGFDPNGPFYGMADLKVWGRLPAGTSLGETVPLFPRIDTTVIEESGASEEVKPVPAPFKPEVTYEDFSRIDLRTATVTAAQAVPKSKRLLKLTVDLGETRTIVAGIAEHYAPEALVGKQVIVVANLKPAKLMGVMSHGMLLAAVNDTATVVATLDKPARPGTPLR